MLKRLEAIMERLADVVSRLKVHWKLPKDGFGLSQTLITLRN